MQIVRNHIDPHVHCRDWRQSHKATIRSVTELARTQGVKAIFDMPNTEPPIVSKELVEKRIQSAKEQGCLDGYYLYIQITGRSKQIREAVEVAKNHPRVVGVKMYSDHVISDEASQSRVFKELSEEGYDGVLAVHAEKESLFHVDLWNANKPWTWNLARPPEAEIESVRDHIEFMKESHFEGKLYFAHITSPEAVNIIRKAKSDLDVYCAVTPHHITFSTANMKGRKGLMFKVNPPLRDSRTVMLLRRYVIEGRVDVIESDHAPHTEEEKMQPPYASGMQSLGFYAENIANLKRDGATEDQIRELTYRRIREIFEDVAI